MTFIPKELQILCHYKDFTFCLQKAKPQSNLLAIENGNIEVIYSFEAQIQSLVPRINFKRNQIGFFYFHYTNKGFQQHQVYFNIDDQIKLKKSYLFENKKIGTAFQTMRRFKSLTYYSKNFKVTNPGTYLVHATKKGVKYFELFKTRFSFPWRNERF